ncbi:MAG: divalent metal cation transporter [Roseivirga sp.]
MSFFNKLQFYAKQSGPGWIQAAVTLGGGTLVSALYLGVVGGYEFLWLQPLAMLMGYVLLSAISHVTLSKTDHKDRPFRLVQKHISKPLAWGWLVATVIANVVFCSAQFALGTDALQGSLGLQNLNPFVITFLLFLVGAGLMWLFSQESRASKIVDGTIKVLVGLIVLCFMGVVIVIGLNGDIQWAELFNGLVPDFGALFKPTETYTEVIQQTGQFQDYWRGYISGSQRDIIIGAFGTAVGINMTFLLPYTLLKKKWKREDRTLARYDLFFGLLIPFILGASFLIIASASQFHGKKDSIVNEQAYHQVLDSRLASEHADLALKSREELELLRASVPRADKDLAVMLAKRTVTDLSVSLRPVLGDWSNLIFGIGVLAMAISTMLVHMMINGYAIAEAFGQPDKRKLFLAGALIPAFAGFISPIIWSGEIKTALAVPASVIATTLLPIAYLIFWLLLNSKKAMGDDRPKKKFQVNALMLLAMGVAIFASVWALLSKIQSETIFEQYFGWIGIVGMPLLIVLGIYSFLKKEKA